MLDEFSCSGFLGNEEQGHGPTILSDSNRQNCSETAFLEESM